MENNLIIALRGRAGCGKTNSIGFLHESLVNDFVLIESSFSRVGSDFWSVFEVKGVRVGITSRGDTYDDVYGDLVNQLLSRDCSTLICACRTSDRTNYRGEIRGSNAAIDEMDGFDAQRINKTISNDGNNEEENTGNNQHDAGILREVLLSQINQINE